MPREISEECICCGACEPECPVEAISDAGDLYSIDKELCTDCGSCQEVCPVDAIKTLQ
jgi:ferredoxin